MRLSTLGRLGLALIWFTLVPSPPEVRSAAPEAAADDRKPQLPDLKVETYTLPNGLTVTLHEDHKTPLVAVHLWYKVGSKDEQTGRTGFAHLFEHMMFQGSKHHDRDYFEPLEKIGATLNGTTSTDRTVYYETVPSNALELALWLESDRMGYLIPAMTQAKLDNQRDVVKNERRQRVDNVPYGQAEEKMLEALYPKGHPYHHSVIGSMADLSAAGMGDVSAFFRKYYSPNNALLALAGDFRPDDAKALIAKYFGPFPKGDDLAPPKPAVPKLAEAKHLTMTDRVTLPRVELVWPTVPTADPDEPALDVLAAVLGGLDKENRLFRALMYDKQLAAHVSAGHPTQKLSGNFEVTLYVRPGQDVDEVVALADKEIERLKQEGPTAAEVRKAKNERESSLIMGLESVTTKASFLNQNLAAYGDALGYKQELLRVFAVKPDDVRRVAKKYLTDKRVRLDVNPGPPAQRAPEVAVDLAHQEAAQEAAVADVKDAFDRSIMPKLGPTPEFIPPGVTRHQLSNGLKVLLAERHSLPIVAFNLVVNGGETLSPKGKDGLAPLTAGLLDEGTKSRDSLQLAGEVAEIGARLGAVASDEETSVSLVTLTGHLDKALDLYTDVILNPSFPEKELKRLQIQKLSSLKARADSPERVAGLVFPRLLYGVDHPYGRFDTIDSVKSLTRADAVALYKKLFVPGNATLIVVGDTTAEAILPKLESAFKSWLKGPVPDQPSVEAPAAKSLAIYLVDKPAAAQSVITVGKVGVPRKTPDYFAISVMNAILGGQFSSRINLNLREEKGYTYGARSGFDFAKGPGPFEAGGTFRTSVTKESLVELIKELTEIGGSRPATDGEIAFAKGRIIQGFPGRFETNSGVGGALATLVVYGLPDDYFATYQPKVEAVTKADVERVAKKYITPGAMTVLVVGDKSQVEGPLRSLPFGKTIHLLDAEGNPIGEDESASRKAASAGGRPARSRVEVGVK
jgi:zinc protease